MTREEFIKKLNFINDEILYAYELFGAYKKIHDKQITDLDALNTIPGFFRMIQYSFLNTTASILARLYDSNSDLRIAKLRNYLDDSYKEMGLIRKTVDIELSKIDAYLAEVKSITPKLKTLRDKELGHNDREKIESNLWKTAGITVGDYEKLIMAAYNIVCICYVLLDCTVSFLGMGIDTQIDTLIAALNMWNKDEWGEEYEELQAQD